MGRIRSGISPSFRRLPGRKRDREFRAAPLPAAIRHRGEQGSSERSTAAYATTRPLTFLFDGTSPAMPSAWNPNEISAPAAIVPFQEALRIT